MAGGVVGGGMTAARIPAGRGGPARPSPAAAERAGPALQKAAAGWPGRSHPAAGNQLRPPHCPLHRGRRPAARPRWQRPPAQSQTTRGPWEDRGPSTPAARGHSAFALSARSSTVAARLGGPVSGWGRASASVAMGRPLGTEQPPEA